MPLEPNAVTVALLLVAGLFMAILGRAVGRAIAEMRWRRRHGGARNVPPEVTVVVRHAASATSPATPPAAPVAASPAGANPPQPAVQTAPLVARFESLAGRDSAPSRLSDIPAPIAYRRPSSVSPALERTARQRPPDAETQASSTARVKSAVPALTVDPPKPSLARHRRALILPTTATLAIVVVAVLAGSALLPPEPRAGVLGATATPGRTGTAASAPGGPGDVVPPEPGGTTVVPPITGGTAGAPTLRPGGGDTTGEPDGGSLDPVTPDSGGPTRSVEPSADATDEPEQSSPPSGDPSPTAQPTAPPLPPTPDPTQTPVPTPAPSPTPAPLDVTFTWTAAGLTVKFTNGTSGPHAWSWEFGDGTSSTARNPSHTYAAAGTYLVRLTATASSGATGTHTASVTVS